MKLTEILNGTTQTRVLPYLHQPERGENETFAEYRERRARSNVAAKRIAGHGLNGGTNSRESFRNSLRANGTMGLRTRASDALMAAWAQKRITKAKHRDEHGAYTCVGSTYEVEGFPPDERFEHVISAGQDADGEPFYTARRKWVAGISAQRGY